MRRAVASLFALVLGAAAAGLVACGGGNGSASLIPSGPASAMQADLDRIEVAVRSGACTGVNDAVARLQDQVNGLSSRVDAGLRQRLQEGVANLATVAPRQCAQGQTTTPATTPPVTTAPPTTATTPTTTTPPTTTTTPPTTTTTTPPVTTTPPPTTTPAPGGGSGGATVPPAGGATTP